LVKKSELYDKKVSKVKKICIELEDCAELVHREQKKMEI
jgi:hypothetical protein